MRGLVIAGGEQLKSERFSFQLASLKWRNVPTENAASLTRHWQVSFLWEPLHSFEVQDEQIFALAAAAILDLDGSRNELWEELRASAKNCQGTQKIYMNPQREGKFFFNHDSCKLRQKKFQICERSTFSSIAGFPTSIEISIVTWRQACKVWLSFPFLWLWFAGQKAAKNETESIHSLLRCFWKEVVLEQVFG